MLRMLGEAAAPHRHDELPPEAGRADRAAAAAGAERRSSRRAARSPGATPSWRSSTSSSRAQALEVRRQDRGHDGRAARPVRRHAWPRTRPACRRNWPSCKRGLPETPKTPKAPRAKPRRQALPEHLERVEHRHEPEDTTCPNADCGQPMQRIGEDVSEKLDIVPAKFFVHRHIYGKWACRCCQQMRQEPAEPDVVDGGIPASRPGGAHADQPLRRPPAVLPAGADQRALGRAHAALDAGHLGWRRRRGTGAAVRGATALHPQCRVLHADETPVPLLDPGAGKTKKAYVWAWARSHHDPHPGVVYEFCLGAGRSTRWPSWAARDRRPEPAWNGTLITDQYAGYNAVLDAKVYPQRKARGVRRACPAPLRGTQPRRPQCQRGGHRGDAALGADLPRRGAFAEMGWTSAGTAASS
jgi:transposase